MNWGVAFFGYQGLTDPATLPLVIVALSISGLVTMPLGNAWSRWRLANQTLADTEPLA